MAHETEIQRGIPVSIAGGKQMRTKHNFCRFKDDAQVVENRCEKHQALICRELYSRKIGIATTSHTQKGFSSPVDRMEKTWVHALDRK